MRSLLSVCLLGMGLIIAVQQTVGEVPSSGTDSGKPPPETDSSAADIDTVQSEPPPGLVYGYGAQLRAPYVFSESEDGKTLYLNGIIYVGPGEGPPPEITVTETVRSQHELNVRAFEQSKRGVTYEDRLEILADVYRSSSLVKDVRKFAQGVYVRWESHPNEEEEVILSREDSAFDLAAFHQKLIAEFRQTVSSGGMIAFGKNYHIYVPAKRLPKTVEQVEIIQGGAPRESLDVMNTALQNKRFVEDLYRQTEGSMEAER